MSVIQLNGLHNQIREARQRADRAMEKAKEVDDLKRRVAELETLLTEPKRGPGRPRKVEVV